jgi:hypothetical protein
LLLEINIGDIVGESQPPPPFNNSYQQGLFALRMRWIASSATTKDRGKTERTIFRDGLGIENDSRGGILYWTIAGSSLSVAGRRRAMATGCRAGLIVISSCADSVKCGVNGIAASATNADKSGVSLSRYVAGFPTFTAIMHMDY